MEEEPKTWRGKWIWYEGLPRTGAMNQQEMVYFRRTFNVEDKKTRLTIQISADSRYCLFLNGKRIGMGPCKSDGHTYYYESYKLDEELQKGTNVLAVQVLHYPASGHGTSPDSIWHTNEGGLIADAILMSEDNSILEDLHSNDQWKVYREQAIQYEAESWMSSNWLGGVERVDGRKLIHEWHKPEYDDADWIPAVMFREQGHLFGLLSPWQLTSRPIPMLYEENKVFMNCVRGNGGIYFTKDEEERFYKKTFDADRPSLLLPSRSRYVVELDAGQLTTGYLRIEFSGGRDASIRILPSECYERNENGKRIKEIRDDYSGGKILAGDSDIYIGAGIGKNDQYEVYEPFWWRTFRFVRLEIQVGETPMQLQRFFYRETGYPLQTLAHFSCSESRYEPLWNISLNTLKRCMHETYEDCPFYEQLQYTMDTRLQMLFTYYVSSDDRLARKAIYDFHSSMLPNGMLQSRYPSYSPQVIPGFSLFWVYMLYDHYWHFGDLEMIRRYRSTLDAVLGFFERSLTTEGLVGVMPSSYWSFIDWTKEWEQGVPHDGKSGPITVHSLMYVAALRQGAELNQASGRNDVAKEYEMRAQAVSAAILKYCWSEEKKLIQDGPGLEQYSEHGQVWAILSEVVTGISAQNLMDRTLKDASLVKLSYAMMFFMYRGLAKTKRYSESFKLWSLWQKMVALHCTTWIEDPVGERSECHAWGAVPLYEFPAEILGVKPEEPGFSRILVSPNPGKLEWANGEVPTPKGRVSVCWRRDHDKFSLEAKGPEGIPLTIQMPDGSNVYSEIGGLLSAECKAVDVQEV